MYIECGALPFQKARNALELVLYPIRTTSDDRFHWECIWCNGDEYLADSHLLSMRVHRAKMLMGRCWSHLKLHLHCMRIRVCSSD